MDRPPENATPQGQAGPRGEVNHEPRSNRGDNTTALPQPVQQSLFGPQDPEFDLESD